MAEIGEQYDTFHFEWNNQKAVVTCVCGETVDLLSDAPEICSCGRMFWLESQVKIDWAQRGDPDLLLG